MSLVTGINAVATRIGQEIKSVRASMAIDTTVVHNSGTETIGGAKTFSTAPAVPVGTLLTHPVRRDDSRLADSRTPVAHNHNANDINAGTLSTDRLPLLTGSPVVVSNAATSITLDASAGSIRDLGCTTATLTINVPTNPTNRQVLRVGIERTTNAALTVTLNASIALSTGLTSRTFALTGTQILLLALEYSTLYGGWILTAATVGG